MDNVWDNSQEVRGSGDVQMTGDASVVINGSSIPVQPGSSLSETIKSMALDAGFGKFRVFLNGAEVKPSEAPDFISQGDRLEVRPYDVAGR